MRVSVPLDKASRILNHGPTVLVASQHGGRRNVMAAAWNMTLDFVPPKVAVVIDKQTLTRELIEASRSFVLAVPCVAQAAMVTAVGHHSGREFDKFAQHGLQTTPASLIDVPLIDGCLAWLECRAYDEPRNEQVYDLFLAEVVAAWAEDWAFAEGRWIPQADEARRALHHLGGGRYLSSSGLIDTQD